MSIAAPTPEVICFFDASVADDTFTWDDATRGLWDSTAYLWGGDSEVDVAAQTFGVTIRRGRSRQLDEIEVGTCHVQLRNEARIFDPDYGAYPGDIRPGKRMKIVAAGIRIFDGRIEDWAFTYDVSGQSTASFVAVDALGILGRAEFDEWTTTAGQAAGARLDAILSRPEVAYTYGRDFGAGTSTLQGDTVSWGSNVLNYAQLVAKSDLGRLFADRYGVLVFQGRANVRPETTALTFSDNGTGIPFSGIEASFGGELLFTRVGVDRAGGTKQSVTDSDAVALYGARSLSITGLLQDSDTQCLDMATYLLGKYSSPEWRISAVTVNLSNCATYAEQQQVLQLDIGDVVSCRFTPNGIAGAVLQTLIIEGVEHELSPLQHLVTFRLTEADEVPLTWDSTTFGNWDSFNWGF